MFKNKKVIYNFDFICLNRIFVFKILNKYLNYVKK